MSNKAACGIGLFEFSVMILRLLPRRAPDLFQLAPERY
jgi:hypothetical protein